MDKQHLPIKMVVSDLDRTLLHTDKTISKYTEDVLIRCCQRGIKVVFATARPKNRVDIFPFLHVANSMISSNGAAIYEKNRLLAHFGIPVENTRSFLRKFLPAFPDIGISVEYDDLAVTNYDISTMWTAEIRNDIHHLPDKEAEKIVVWAGPEMMESVCKILPDQLYAQLCEKRLILIMPKTTTKWTAIQYLSDHWKILPDEIVSFGDDFNDIVMLRCCGMGIAVSNGIEEVKSIADDICDSNDQDGVAKWLEINVLQEFHKHS